MKITLFILLSLFSLPMVLGQTQTKHDQREEQFEPDTFTQNLIDQDEELKKTYDRFSAQIPAKDLEKIFDRVKKEHSTTEDQVVIAKGLLGIVAISGVDPDLIGIGDEVDPALPEFDEWDEFETYYQSMQATTQDFMNTMMEDIIKTILSDSPLQILQENQTK